MASGSQPPDRADIHYYAPILTRDVSLSWSEYRQMDWRELLAFHRVRNFHREQERKSVESAGDDEDLQSILSRISGIEYEPGQLPTKRDSDQRPLFSWADIQGEGRKVYERSGLIRQASEVEINAHDERLSKRADAERQAAQQDPRLQPYLR